jgi:hypothetical protein
MYEPVTKNQLLDLIDLLSRKIESVFSDGFLENGFLTETADEYEVEKVRLKIQAKQDEIRKLRQLLMKARNVITRRREFEKQRK